MKKLLLILVGVPIVLILILGIVFLNASRDIDPPNVLDLVPNRADVAEADNAFTYFSKAVAASYWPEDDELLRKILDDKTSDPAYIADFLARNKEALKLLDQGLECRICQTPEVKTNDDSGKYTTKWRTLSRLLWLKAMYDRETGQWADSVEACDKLLRLGNLVQENAGCLVQYLVGTAFLNKGFDASRKLAVSPEVPEAELRLLAEALNRVGSLKEGLAQAVRGEYQMLANTVDGLVDGTVSLNGDLDLKSFRHPGYSFQPNKTKQMFADEFRQLLNNIDLPVNDRNTEAIYQRPEDGAKRFAWMLSPNGVGKILVALMVPACDAVLEAGARCEGELAGTRLIVACRRYEKEHGQLPPTLDALVPKYLDAVPIDPYDGKPMRYDEKRAIVYSIGVDLADSSGSDQLPSGEPADDENYYRWDNKDAVFYIHGRPKASEPAESP